MVPSNFFVGSTNSLDAIIKTDTDVTGLSVEGVLSKVTIDIVNKDYKDDLESHIIIPPGQKLALLWDQATGVISGEIYAYEDQGVL